MGYKLSFAPNYLQVKSEKKLFNLGGESLSSPHTATAVAVLRYLIFYSFCIQACYEDFESTIFIAFYFQVSE